MKLQLLITLLGATYSLAQTCNKGSLVCCETLKDTGGLTKPLEGVLESSGSRIGGDMSKDGKTGIKCKSDIENCQRDKLACCGFSLGGNYVDCSLPHLSPEDFAQVTAPEQVEEYDGEGNHHRKKKHHAGGGLGGIPGLSGIADIPGF